MSTYTIRYNRTTDHIDGLSHGASDSQMNYSLSACGALSKNGHRMAVGAKSDDLATILRSAGITRKICKTCQAAAAAELAAQAEEN